jgi:hypothetical protein
VVSGMRSLINSGVTAEDRPETGGRLFACEQGYEQANDRSGLLESLSRETGNEVERRSENPGYILVQTGTVDRRDKFENRGYNPLQTRWPDTGAESGNRVNKLLQTRDRRQRSESENDGRNLNIP